ncbi:MAG: DUF4147 domain-containing protein [Planctomycetes bacterium]|nr:DUF4147 domain-containing protein [Planctomycetota bacterium]
MVEPSAAAYTKSTHDALRIWRAGVDAVGAERLMGQALLLTGSVLTVCGHTLPLADWDRIAVVGAGKAGAGMAAAVEEVLGPAITEQRVTGWVNVPADCVRPLRRIHLHAARPAGVNEPTLAGAEGAAQILNIVSQLGPRDLCLVLISGGGSALLPAPVEGVSLADKLAVTRFLMQSGATIDELNTVRKQLSRIKGGGLARASRAGRMITLIISDVVGDPLDVIASGPTVDDRSTAADAQRVLQKFGGRPPVVPESIFRALERGRSSRGDVAAVPAAVENHVIGNNAVALAAAAAEARTLGYAIESLGAGNQGEANAVGVDLAERCLRFLQASTSPVVPTCFLSGGEPVVQLAPTVQPRKGGRNQQVALAALCRLGPDLSGGLTILSGGTDGEDGPTDAAGAFVDAGVQERARSLQLDPHEYLAINNAYPFFEQAGGLIRTGPTHTNVMDLRVAICRG